MNTDDHAVVPPDPTFMPDPKDLAELRGHIEFAQVCSFFHLFGHLYGMDQDFETEALESQLLNPVAVPALNQVITKMMRAVTLNRFIHPDTWVHYLAKEFEKRDMPPLINYGQDFFTLPLFTKMQILLFLCEWQFEDPDRIRNVLKDEEDEASEWRIDPVGRDATGTTYWMFDDNRLYMEVKEKVKLSPPRAARTRKTAAPSPPASNSNTTHPSSWQLVCLTRDDWKTFPERFKSSKDPEERHLYSFLHEHALPMVLESMQEKEVRKRERERDTGINVKPSSRIHVKDSEDIERKATLRSYARPEDLQRTPDVKPDNPVSERDKRREERERWMREKELESQVTAAIKEQAAIHGAEDDKRRIELEKEKEMLAVQRAEHRHAKRKREDIMESHLAEELRQREVASQDDVGRRKTRSEAPAKKPKLQSKNHQDRIVEPLNHTDEYRQGSNPVYLQHRTFRVAANGHGSIEAHPPLNSPYHPQPPPQPAHQPIPPFLQSQDHDDN
ncbi:hypothetical protein SeMB42_g07808 [Synchytrium endobioticum]|uniref:DDT domain-containing protein n=1 Tax=Synchytrium endobioticum TaxID=286115 RepID=A0A507BZC7_9FUNG|nr:hypothetical protein SeMB42_g07808 [Synchytrium endobioticum]